MSSSPLQDQSLSNQILRRAQAAEARAEAAERKLAKAMEALREIEQLREHIGLHSGERDTCCIADKAIREIEEEA